MSGENSPPWSKTLVLLTVPISLLSTFKIALDPWVDAIEVKIGRFVDSNPRFKMSMLKIPPISPVDFVE